MPARKHPRPKNVHPMIEEQFAARALDPSGWARHARRSKRVGDLVMQRFSNASDLVIAGKVNAVDLADDLELLPHATYQYGNAIENLLKGVILKRIVPPLSEISAVIDGPHDLVELAKRAHVALSPTERDLLRRMSKFVEWAGRYPIPKKVSQMVVRQDAASIVVTTVNPSTGKKQKKAYAFIPLPMRLDERSIFERLFDRIERQILT